MNVSKTIVELDKAIRTAVRSYQRFLEARAWDEGALVMAEFRERYQRDETTLEEVIAKHRAARAKEQASAGEVR
ncbi:MAG: hypothetical protein IMY86_13835 [Chloroflexi bacterium]|nr:hypothetical protein [Chloroflexota bacterium]